MLLRSLLVACLLCAAPLLVPTARGERRELADARRLFAEGVERARAGQWQLALAAFEAAYEIAAQPTILFNLASAQQRSGRLLASTANFRRFLNSADPGISATQLRVARAELANVEARIPRLRLDIGGLEPGDRVLLDQTRIYPDELGRDMWIDPGLHEVLVDRPQGNPQKRAVEVHERQRRLLSFRMP